MRRGSAPIPTILQHRHGEPAGLIMQMFITYAPGQRADSNHPPAQTCNTPVPDEWSSATGGREAQTKRIGRQNPTRYANKANSQVHRLELLGFKVDSNSCTSQAERAPPHDLACGTMRKHLFGK